MKREASVACLYFFVCWNKPLTNLSLHENFFSRKVFYRDNVPVFSYLTDGGLFFLATIIPVEYQSLMWGWEFFKSRLQNDVCRFGRGLAGLFSQQILLSLIERCSNQHAEIFVNETNMRRFESVFTNRITTS